LGEIVYKTLIRLFLIIAVLWFVQSIFDTEYFLIISFLTVFFFVINPAYLSYQDFISKNSPVINNSLCTSCKHFDKSAVLCIKYDKHPTEEIIPCEGTAWEPE
jgi:hypothetical protein